MESDPFIYQTMMTCIGNKRKLIGEIMSAVWEVRRKLGKTRLRMMDAFTGSTVVARAMTYSAEHLYVNDQEYYSYIMSRCFLEVPTPEQESRVRYHIERMNEIARDGPHTPGIICQHYAPQKTEEIQEGERCFYTRENALIIDTLRSYIDEHGEPELQHYLLAPLLTKASIHANTSGVFKGFYKDRNGKGCFGGEGRNALSRIMGKIELEMPIWNRGSPYGVTVLRGDIYEALEEIPDNSLDLIYMDPPYNMHPYGSNYFMLNIIAENREPEKISRVSGIPEDWNRSVFNQRGACGASLQRLIEIGLRKASYVLISYNNEGYVTEDEWERILSPYPHRRHEREYDTFKGSRNLRERNIKVTEYLYVVGAL